jgi:putative sterol carrier protein
MTAREFIYGLQENVHPDSISDKNTRFHFQLQGEGGGDFTVDIAKGEMNINDGLAGEAKCVVKAKADNFMKVINGDIKPFMALLTGKVKVSDQGELIKYAKIFGLM